MEKVAHASFAARSSPAAIHASSTGMEERARGSCNVTAGERLSKPPPVVYLIDDDHGVLSALRRVLSIAEYEVVCCPDAESFLEEHDPDVPGCAIVDLELPGIGGFEIQRHLVSSQIRRPLIYLSGKGDIPASVHAMKHGAIDFLTKPVQSAVLLEAVAKAIRLDILAREEDERRKSIESRLYRLTPRERQVLGLVVAGLLNKQIAFQLGTVEKTVKVHRAGMMAKMDVHTVADLVRIVTLYGEGRQQDTA